MNKFSNLIKNYFSPKVILIGITSLFGLIFLTNSMIRFDNQILTCSFWLLCEGKDYSLFQSLFNFQTLISIFGFISLIFSLRNKKLSEVFHRKKLTSIFIIAFSVVLVINSLLSWLPLQSKILLQIILSLIVSILIMANFADVNQKAVIDQPINKNHLFYKRSVFLAISSLMMVILGVTAAMTEASTLCNQFPVCFINDGFRIEELLVNSHRIFTLISGILLVLILKQTWKEYRENEKLLVSVTMSFIIFLGQSLIGAVQIYKNFDLNLLFIHSVSSYIYLLMIAFIFQLSRKIPISTKEYKSSFFNSAQIRKDYLTLNKPIIVALLLVTTYAGMVVGGEKIPSISLTIWTMLGGALAAGGASAINQYLDRDIDSSMQRTQKRPLPSGRLYPAEALTLGIAEIFLAFYILSAFVNLNAAILAMVGMAYYVFLYSKWLKHITVQNIVIGGGVGAIPPLVGWAAATGGLNVPSMFLFALVFLWTPPHFWALALVRKNDYARANIPMMPVVQGEKKTRLQILIYTIQLVGLTLLMPLFGVGGGIYLILAFVLGLWLLGVAWQVYKIEGNKIAFKMYRYSSMYLAFIFLALVVDILV